MIRNPVYFDWFHHTFLVPHAVPRFWVVVVVGVGRRSPFAFDWLRDPAQTLCLLPSYDHTVRAATTRTETTCSVAPRSSPSSHDVWKKGAAAF